MAKIYLLNIENGVDEEICRAAFPERYNKARKNPSRDAALRSMGAGVLLNRVLGLTEKDILTGEKGKPYCKDGHIHFSLSHSRNYCALATDPNEVGVDVELADERHLSAAKRVLLPEEIKYMEQDPTRFFILWTLKESVGKAIGKGLGLGFQTFSVLPLLEGKPITVEKRNFYGQSTRIDGYALSVVTENEQTEFSVERTE